MSDLDASELLSLVEYFDGAEKGVAEKTYPVVEQHAKELRDQWQENARQTAGRHGRHYPSAITAEQLPLATEIAWEVGPERRRKQGNMSFEYGSRNQAPHLDGANAAIEQEPRFLAAVDEIARGLL